MAWHVSEPGNCPNTLLSCPFKDAGCDIKVRNLQVSYIYVLTVEDFMPTDEPVSLDIQEIRHKTKLLGKED